VTHLSLFLSFSFSIFSWIWFSFQNKEYPLAGFFSLARFLGTKSWLRNLMMLVGFWI
ncbi:hypothetical protein Tsubulata_042175, partial [Turnera subulata]